MEPEDRAGLWISDGSYDQACEWRACRAILASVIPNSFRQTLM